MNRGGKAGVPNPCHVVHRRGLELREAKKRREKSSPIRNRRTINKKSDVTAQQKKNQCNMTVGDETR